MSKGLHLVLILGAHRSGTSALAGALERCGLPLGPVERAGSSFNERGHFSNPAVDALTSALLAPQRSQLVITREDTAAIDEILTAYEPPLAGIKSPDLMYTAVVWAQRSAGTRVIATIRHPSEVARSARRRLMGEQGSAPELETLLERWSGYNRLLLELRDKLEFPIVDFSAPLDVYVQQVRWAVEALDLRFDRHAVSTFLADELRHERQHAVEETASRLFVRLQLCAAAPPARAQEVPPEDALATFGPPLMPVRMDDEGVRLSDRWHLSHLRLARLIRENQRLSAAATDAIAARDAEIRRLQATLRDSVDARDSEIRRLQAALRRHEHT